MLVLGVDLLIMLPRGCCWCYFLNNDDDDDAVMVEGACNVEVRRRLGWENEDNEAELRLFLVAIRDIDAGVEICYDYGEEYWWCTYAMRESDDDSMHMDT